MRKSALARKNERIIRLKSENEFVEKLDEKLCDAINSTAIKFGKRLKPEHLNKLIVKTLSEQLHYAIHEERRF